MKRIYIILALVVSAFAVSAQEKTNGSSQKTMPSTGDYFQGLTRP